MSDFNLLPVAWRNVLLSLVGDCKAEAGHSTATPTIASIFCGQQPTKINDEVYALHDPAARPTLEVVFFHGFELGDYQDLYWRNWLCADETHCWPKTWLVGDWPDARVLSVAYDSSLMRTSTTGRLDLYKITENLRFSLIDDAGVGQKGCPVIFVGHSLGGVVMKALCARAKRYQERRQGYPAHKKQRRDLMENFVDNLKGLFFLATPHEGSIFSDGARSSLAGPLMDELKVLDSQSARLNQDFVQFLGHHPSIKLWGVAENQPTRLGKFFDMVVPESSARFSKYDNYYTASTDHFGVCKPESKESSTYKFLTRFLRDVINEVEHRAVDSETALQGPSKFSFNSDRRYIPLKQTEEKVITALKHFGGPPIILLHGGSGTGKSALTRNLALNFQKEIEERIEGHASYIQQVHTSGPVFDRVVYMECGPEVALPAKQRELAQKLDLSAISTIAATGIDIQDKGEFNNMIIKLLSRLLKYGRFLIILDDVWECKDQGQPDFLQGMVSLGGERMKWLVTSQSQDLCQGLNIRGPCRIGMENVKRKDGRRILAALTGLEESDLIPEIKVIMDRIVAKTGANLLAMTCVASTVSEERYKQKEEWKRLERNLLDTLNSPAAIRMHDIGHRQSYWGAIRLGFNHLSRAQKNLLILIHMCEGPSILSDVVEYLFQQTRHGNWCEAFSRARDALQGRQLLTIKTANDPILGDKERWSIHDLLREFINREIFGDLAGGVPIVDTLSKEEIMFEKGNTTKLEHEVVMGVASLYFGNNFGEFVEKMGISLWTPESADLGKQVIDPIAHLLGLIENEQWTSALHSYISQVLLKYVRHKEFDDASTSHLLNSPISKIPILCSLQRSATWDYKNQPLIGRQIIHTLFRLLEGQITLVIRSCPNCLSSRDCTLLRWISSAFALTVNGQGKISTPNLETIIEQLMLGIGEVERSRHSICLAEITHKSEHMSFNSDIIKHHQPKKKFNSDIRVLCLTALANLACGGGGIKEKMIDFPELLESLVKAMRTKDSPDLQAQAALSILHLVAEDGGATEIMGLKIVDYQGVLDALVDGLDTSKSQQFRTTSAFALANLAGFKLGEPGDQIRWKIIMFDGALRKLIFAMHDVDDHEVNKQSARALANLACGGGGIKEKMIDFPELLESLVKAMRTKDSSDLQAEAARSILNLAAEDAGATEIMGLKIVDYQGVLDALVDGLDTSKNQQFQIYSAWALANLAGFKHGEPGDQIRWKIIMFDGALRKLIFAMRDVDDHEVNKESARALASLACGGGDIKMKMIDFPGLLESFLNVHDNDVKRHCTRAIHNMAEGDNDIRMKMKVNFPDILDVLENAVARAETSGGDIYDGILALTLLDPLRAKVIQVDSAAVYLYRGFGELLLGLYKDAREDLDRYEAICTLEQNPTAKDVFSLRCCAKAKLGDLQGALADADSLVCLECTGLALQERGVVKRMLGDLCGALEDLNASLCLSDEDDYEVLKHRGFVHFLMNDEESARADAERAIKCKPSCVDRADYGRDCLGTSSIQYLDFELR